MDEDARIRVNVETQTFRFIPGNPISHDDAVRLAKGIKSGPWVVISHKAVSYTHLTLPTKA